MKNIPILKKALPLCAVFIYGLITETNAGTTTPVEVKSEGKGGSWYAGMEGGYIQHKFNPRYTPANGGSSFGFTNRSEGIELGLVAGYGFELTERFSLSTQLRGSWNNSAWKYHLPSEPARFKFDNPFNIELSAQPTLRITDKLGIFATIGILEGIFNEEKKTYSATHGNFDASDWLFGYTIGGGLIYQISDTLECRLSYRKSFYDELSYRDHLPSGGKKNSISDEPESETFALSIIYRF